MKLEDVNKKMPFGEPNGYVSQLVDSATEKAIMHSKQNRGSVGKASSVVFMRIAAVGLVVLSLAGLGWFYQPTTLEETELANVSATQNGPLEAFLNNISDEDAQMIKYYEIETIPEY